MDQETYQIYRNKLIEFKKRCDEPLQSGWIRTRKGDKGYPVNYIEAGYVQRALNTVFTPLGWSRKVLSDEIIDESKTRTNKHKIVSKCLMTLRIHPFGLCNGVYAEFDDVGTGTSFAGDRGVAISQAVKNSYTDAIKRCGKTLGDYFGLGLSLDQEVAEKLGAIKQSSKNPIDAFTDRGGPKGSKTYSWLEPSIYEEMMSFWKENKDDPESNISLSLRDRVLKNAVSVFSKTFRVVKETTETTLFEIWGGIGVASEGHALPAFSQLTEFLNTVDSRMKGKEEAGISKKKVTVMTN